MNDSATSRAPRTLGRYQLLSRLGVGGMAEVWLAEMSGLGGFRKTLVVKTMHANIAESPEFVKMFVKEASVVARLNHPNVVQIYELGEIDGCHYIAMEYIPGRTLRQIRKQLKATESGSGGLPHWFLLHAILRVCDGLHYAHELCDDAGTPLGLVHRDVSPENVMVSFAGSVKLLDFGVVKLTSAEKTVTSGTMVGKFGYMSPELIRGDHVDRRSDVYALGVVLYELLTGTRPFRASGDVAVLAATLEGKFPDPREIDPTLPDELARIVLRAMARDPDDRHPDASALQRDLAEYLEARGLRSDQGQLAAFVSSTFPDSPEIPPHVRNALAAGVRWPEPRDDIRASRVEIAAPARAPITPAPPTFEAVLELDLADLVSVHDASPPARTPEDKLLARPPSVPAPPARDASSSMERAAATASKPANVASEPAPIAAPSPSKTTSATPEMAAPAPAPAAAAEARTSEPNLKGGESHALAARATSTPEPKPPATESPSFEWPEAVVAASARVASDIFSIAIPREPPPSSGGADVFTSRTGAGEERRSRPNPASLADVFTPVSGVFSPRADIFAAHRAPVGRQGEPSPASSEEGATTRARGKDADAPAGARAAWGPYQKLTVDAPRKPTAADHFQRGLDFVRASQFEDARAAWEEAVALEPTNRSYQTNLQRLKERLKAK